MNRNRGHATAVDGGPADPAGLPAPDAADSLDPNFATRFAFLLDTGSNPADRLPEGDASVKAGVLAVLDALGAATVADTDESGFTSIPPIFTYFGQFIDHDMTANTDREEGSKVEADGATLAVKNREEAAALRNRRHPSLRLDSVYGHVVGAKDRLPLADAMRAGPKMRVGELFPVVGSMPVGGLRRDLPRFDALLRSGVVDKETFGNVPGYTALIGDPRNEENTLIGQLHCSFLRFHNAVVDWLAIEEPSLKGEALFDRARELTVAHYQWVVVREYLDLVGDPGIVAEILDNEASVYRDRRKEVKEDFMPLEFSVAAFRFGHTMVRPIVNLNGARDKVPFIENFVYTGHARPEVGEHVFAATDHRLPSDRAIDFTRFVTCDFQTARPIDTRLAPPLSNLIFAPPSKVLRHLAIRNLRRGYVLALPTGQAAARGLGVPVLSPADVRADLTIPTDAFDWTERTPLWFYLLREAEVAGGGNRLGALGTRLVAETIIGALGADKDSILNRGWTPKDGVRAKGGTRVKSLADMLQFAGVL
ncbi:MAG: peroxidase family protein [Sandaracinaceae bacterium]